MAQLPVVTGHEAIRAFERAGFDLDHWRGDHAILYRPDGRHLSVPRGRKEVKPGTLRSLIRGAGLTVEEFVALLRE
jgi:predicted RNA binding protein YcfA (HicA-like mRNA interferase family)